MKLDNAKRISLVSLTFLCYVGPFIHSPHILWDKSYKSTNDADADEMMLCQAYMYTVAIIISHLFQHLFVLQPVLQTNTASSAYSIKTATINKTFNVN